MIGYYAHHQGSGHVIRLGAIASELDGPVTGLSSLPAPTGWQGDWVQLAPDDDEDAVTRDCSANGVLHWAPTFDAGLRRRTRQIVEWIERADPDLLVTDVSVEVSLLARLCGVPVVVMAMPGDRLDRPHRTAYDLADHLLAAWPRGALTDSWPQTWLDKTWYVGGISRFDATNSLLLREFAASRGRNVVVLWGAGGRATTDEQVLAAMNATPDWRWTDIGTKATASQVWRHLSQADVVVAHAGQNVVAEVAAARRPAVIVAEPRPHDEQLATARALNRLGLAVGLDSWPDAECWPDLLSAAQRIGGAKWTRWSRGGSARAARLIAERAAHLRLARSQPRCSGGAPQLAVRLAAQP